MQRSQPGSFESMIDSAPGAEFTQTKCYCVARAHILIFSFASVICYERKRRTQRLILMVLLSPVARHSAFGPGVAHGVETSVHPCHMESVLSAVYAPRIILRFIHMQSAK